MVAFSSMRDKEVSLKLWHANGKRVIIFLNDQLTEMIKLSKNCSTTRIWSCRAGITGAVCVTAGIILVPFTAGASAALLSLCGSGLSLAAGAVNSGTSVYEIKKENAKADMIMARLRQFLGDSQSLLEVISENKLETQKWMSVAMAAAQKLLPAAGALTAVALTGAPSAVLQENPSTSYFCKADESEVCFNGDIKTNTLANIGAVVAVIGAIWSMIEFWKELEQNKRITEGRATSQFVQKLQILRDALQEHLGDPRMMEPVQEQTEGPRRRQVIAQANDN